MNKIILSGRLCNDLDIRTTADGKTVAKFNFAVNRRFKRDGEPEADFFQCVSFGKIAETLQKCSVGKGTKLLIEGEIQDNNWESEGGIKHYGKQVIIGTFEFCESKSSSGRSETEAAIPDMPQNDGFMPAINDDGDDLPF